MRASYHHLTREQRNEIYLSLKTGKSHSTIAQELGVSRSTISREIHRNRGDRGYRPKQADEKAEARKTAKPKRRDCTPQTQERISVLLQLEWSPQQIAGRLASEGVRVSHERIYQYIYADKKTGGSLWTHLRQARKKYRKRISGKDRRGQIPDRVSIESRPAVVGEKKRIGDWEADTVIGANHEGVIVTLVERVTKQTLIAAVPSKHAEVVTQAIITLLTPYKDHVHTITVDNGKEFTNHKDIALALDTLVYFAHPYHSWERGLNENTNGLIRQYFPKSESLFGVSEEQTDFVMQRLNNRPRKTLGFLTPNEVFLPYVKSPVAFVS